jgi:putative membrane protein insertion efficiency factor
MELSANRHGQARERVRRIALVPRRAALALISGYRRALVPLLAWDCRHLPTCSEYAEEAIGRFGVWAGGWMVSARLLRCHPMGTRGLDFVPTRLPDRARWYLPWRYGRWKGTNADFEGS